MQRRIGIGAFGAVFAALLVLGMIDTLVWLPSVTAPGIPLARIYIVLAGSGDLIACTLAPLIWFLFWGVLAALFVALQLPIHRAFVPVVLRPISAAAVGLLLLGAAGFLQWWSAIAMGMSVSDELPPGFGTTTTLGTVIVLGGLVLLLVGSVLGLVAVVTRPRPAPALA